eukprot:652630_1
MTPFLLIFLACILHLISTKRVNFEVTLHRKDAFTLFSTDEIWGVRLPTNDTDIIQLNVVINESKSIVFQAMKGTILALNMIHDDADAALEEERIRLHNRTKWTPSSLPDLFFLEYRDWREYSAFISAFPVRFRDLASLSYMGSTVEGRRIPVVTLSTGIGPKPGFYIQAALHAREWLANSATTYILNALAEGYATGDERITKILNAINIYIAPTINIDGYIYTWEVNRNWRKNRRPNGGSSFGVDLNRNYDGPTGAWGTTGTSTNPNSDVYCGTAPFSEPETQASTKFVLNPEYNIKASFDMHTYGQLILWPWGFVQSTVPPPYFEAFKDLGNALQSAVFNVNGEVYQSMQACDLYVNSGNMIDFAFSESPDKMWSFTFEGRGSNFVPPPADIIPAGQEQLAAVLTMSEYIMNKF